MNLLLLALKILTRTRIFCARAPETGSVMLIIDFFGDSNNSAKSVRMPPGSSISPTSFSCPRQKPAAEDLVSKLRSLYETEDLFGLGRCGSSHQMPGRLKGARLFLVELSRIRVSEESERYSKEPQEYSPYLQYPLSSPLVLNGSRAPRLQYTPLSLFRRTL